MARIHPFTASALILALLAGLGLASLSAMADTTVIDGPGFKVEKKRGWFGRKSTTYTDMFGNRVENRTGLFGRKTTKTKLFGSEATKKGDDVTVTGPNGKPLITRKKKLFGGRETHVDGNGIVDSVQEMLKQTTP